MSGMSQPLLEVADLRFTYPDGAVALRGVSFTMTRGERVGLVGPNGSGKSTLLLCLSGLAFGEGTVRIEGVELTEKSTQQLRGRIGLVFQSPDDQLFMPTVADDLAFGPINQGLDDAEVQARVGATADALKLTPMLERAPHHLSMGQKRNAAIGSVLTMNPALLLMDEPSSNLDPRARRQLISVLAELGTTLLIASHDLALIGRLCERVLLIDGGQIIADGPTRQLLADAELMERHGLEAWTETMGART